MPFATVIAKNQRRSRGDEAIAGWAIFLTCLMTLAGPRVTKPGVYPIPGALALNAFIKNNRRQA
jgi:hypothetical protein